ncbi:MAG: hypothetical protein MUP71_12090 [Candidatus Aminicenantes bacterium]|nr:hypothetical protein [Candidatus Aminicenantes bacterium]
MEKQMTTQQVVLIAAGISAIVSIIVSILSAFLNHFLATRRERGKKLWDLDLEKTQKIEELAGKITEILGSYYSPEKTKEMVAPLLTQFEQNMGALLTYKDLNQSMRDLQNAAQRVIHFSSLGKDVRPIKEDLRAAFEKLKSACDLVSKGKGK